MSSLVGMNRFLKLFYFLLIGVVLFSLSRLTILVVYFDNFKDLDFYKILLSILHGIRFDASILVYILGIFIILLLIPINNRLYHKSILWIGFAYYILLSLFLIGDIIYYGEVNRHVTNEIFTILNHGHLMVAMVKEYILYLILFIIIVFISGYFYKKFVNIEIKNIEYKTTYLVKYFAYFVVAIALSIIIARGGFNDRPIQMLDAYVIGDVKLGNLTLNGFFTSLSLYFSGNNFDNKNRYRYLDNKVAHEIIDSYKHNKCIEIDEFPEKPNIIFILVESLSAYHMTSFSDFKVDIVPNMNRMAKEGISFIRHYAPERRSRTSIQAILTGMPPMEGVPTIGFGLEGLSDLGNIGSIFDQNGYRTIMIQSSPRKTDYLNKISLLLGFKEYYGFEDFKKILDYENYEGSIYGWDYETFIGLKDVLKENENEKPFFAFLFTGSTHVPYSKPPKEHVKYEPHGSNTRNGYYNNMLYTDWSLNEFIKSIENEKFFKNTIFIISGDHTQGSLDRSGGDDDYRVPLIIWGKPVKNSFIVDNVTSHADMPVTLYDLAHINYNKDMFTGSNVFCKNEESYAVVTNFGPSGIITKDKKLFSSFSKVLEVEPKNMDNESINKLSDLLKAYYQENYNIITKKQQ